LRQSALRRAPRRPPFVESLLGASAPRTATR
jgi:hypothetical protein